MNEYFLWGAYARRGKVAQERTRVPLAENLPISPCRNSHPQSAMGKKLFSSHSDVTRDLTQQNW